MALLASAGWSGPKRATRTLCPNPSRALGAWLAAGSAVSSTTSTGMTVGLGFGVVPPAPNVSAERSSADRPGGPTTSRVSEARGPPARAAEMAASSPGTPKQWSPCMCVTSRRRMLAGSMPAAWTCKSDGRDQQKGATNVFRPPSSNQVANMPAMISGPWRAAHAVLGPGMLES